MGQTTLQRREARPASWIIVPTPSRMRMWVNPISCNTVNCVFHKTAGEMVHTLIYSSFVYSGILNKMSTWLLWCSQWTAYSSNVLTTRKIVTTISTALYPCTHKSFNFSTAVSISDLMHARIIDWMMIGCGWSQTLNTLSPETKPNPECVDCKLLIACRMSPSAVNIRAVSPSSFRSTLEAPSVKWQPYGVIIMHLFHVAYLQESLENLLIFQLRIPQNSTSTLYRFDDFVAHIAGKTKTRRIWIDLHSTS